MNDRALRLALSVLLLGSANGLVQSSALRASPHTSARLAPAVVHAKHSATDGLDRDIAKIFVPSFANLVVVPIVGAVDCFWVGRMGDTLALAGQGAANQLFNSLFFLLSFLPTVTAPLVASTYAAGDIEGARDRVCDSLFVASLIGTSFTALLVWAPSVVLQIVLSPEAPAAQCAARYLKLRSLSLLPALVSAVGFAAFRGCLEVTTPLAVSAASNTVNAILDPLLIFKARIGLGGAAIATAISEACACVAYLVLLLRRRLLTWARFCRPSLASMVPLLKVPPQDANQPTHSPDATL